MRSTGRQYSRSAQYAPAGRGGLRKIYTPIIFHHLYGQPADLRSGEDAFYVHIRPLALGRGQLSLSGSGQNRLYQDRLFLEPGTVCFAGLPSRQQHQYPSGQSGVQRAHGAGEVRQGFWDILPGACSGCSQLPYPPDSKPGGSGHTISDLHSPDPPISPVSLLCPAGHPLCGPAHQSSGPAGEGAGDCNPCPSPPFKRGSIGHHSGLSGRGTS